MLVLTAMVGCGEDDIVDPGEDQHTFVYAPHSETRDFSSVVVRGSFNDWSGNDVPMTQQADGTWEADLQLEPGTYEYKYVFTVNGEEMWADNMCADPTWGNPPGGPVVPGLETCTGSFNNAVLVIE